jgi:putative folate metabolism gamma-glutamate ligase
MIIKPIKTPKIRTGNQTITDILNESVTDLREGSVLTITSKIISLCEGRVVKISDASKADLIKQESQFFIPPEKSKYDITLTITRNILIPTAGIDESNGDGYYVLWPENPQKSAFAIRDYLVEKYKLKSVGVLITDSKTTPLRYGITGIGIGYAGFWGLNDYIGTPDLFGRNLEVTQASVIDGLAAAAVAVMGEGNEQTPISIISEVPFVRFEANAPSAEELKLLQITPEVDIYSPLIENAPWEKGNGTL